MVTVVTKTISLSGTPDYSTLQAWEDAAPVDLVTADQIWRGEISLPGDVFTARLLVAGSTTDATRYKELTAAAGASFIDHVDAATNPLRIDFTKGCGINRAGTDDCLAGLEGNFHVSRLQFGNINASRSFALSRQGGLGGLTIDKCIFEASGSSTHLLEMNGTEAFPAYISNSYICSSTTPTPDIVSTTGNVTFANCTIVIPSDVGKSSIGITMDMGTSLSATLTNCAIFGVTDEISGTMPVTINNCYTEATLPQTGFTTIPYDTTTGSGFVSITDATRDFRIKDTSQLLNGGTSDPLATTDILDTPRPVGLAYDVGAYEYINEFGDDGAGHTRGLLLGVY